jgi:glutaredoxin
VSRDVPEVLMYARPGCGLCDEARDVIMAERARTPFEYREVDVEEDDALELEYGIRIPVVLVDGRELFEIAVDAGRLAEAVRR